MALATVLYLGTPANSPSKKANAVGGRSVGLGDHAHPLLLGEWGLRLRPVNHPRRHTLSSASDSTSSRPLREGMLRSGAHGAVAVIFTPVSNYPWLCPAGTVVVSRQKVPLSHQPKERADGENPTLTLEPKKPV